jgi:hypothetical protein
MRRLVLTRAIQMALLLAVIGPASAQVGFDRPGNGYTHFDVAGGDPVLCAARCERDAKCRAWSFQYPATAGDQPTCELKSRVPERVKAPFFISGVRGQGIIEAPGRDIEYSTDRHGGDYRNFKAPPEADGQTCQDACKADNKCRAWTYLRPGYRGAGPRCYLKSHVTRPRREPCCISGVVR